MPVTDDSPTLGLPTQNVIMSVITHGHLSTKHVKHPYVAALVPALPEQLGGAADIDGVDISSGC